MYFKCTFDILLVYFQCTFSVLLVYFQCTFKSVSFVGSVSLQTAHYSTHSNSELFTSDRHKVIIPPALGASDLVIVERVNIDIAPLPAFTGLPFHSNITRLLYNYHARSRSR